MPPLRSLNESPSEKEGKLAPRPDGYVSPFASMKVPPKRKGNTNWAHHLILSSSLNESPSEKEGKCDPAGLKKNYRTAVPLNESPSEKEGKWRLPP